MVTNGRANRDANSEPMSDQDLKRQFSEVENDLVDVETFTEQRPDDDIDETSAGGLQYPPGVKTSGAGVTQRPSTVR